MAQRRKYRTTEAGDRGIVDARGLPTLQVSNSRGAGIVGDRVQRGARQIKKQCVIGLVEENDGIAFQVMDTRIACPQVAYGRLPAVLPIFTIGKIAEYQPDQKGIFPLD